MGTLSKSFLCAARHALLVLSPALLLAQSAPPEPPAPPLPPSVLKLTGVGGSFLGVGFKEIDTQRAKALRLKDEYGVEVTRVEDESPAAKAGLKVGDAVLEYNGQRVEGTEQFIRLVRETPPGRTVKLLVSRDGGSVTLAATIGTRKSKSVGEVYGFSNSPEGMRIEIPRMEMMMPDVPKAMMSWRSATLGVEAEALGDSQLAAYFGVKEGVLVRSVMKGTAAEKAGIKAGDVLIRVDESKVTSPREVTNAVRNAQSNAKRTFPVALMRDRKEISLPVTLEEDAREKALAPRGQRVTVKHFQ